MSSIRIEATRPDLPVPIGAQEWKARILVTDVAGAPLAGVSLFTLAGAVEVSCGLTDQGGIALLPESDFVDQVIARKEGYALATLRISKIEIEDEFKLVMYGSQTISGRILSGTTFRPECVGVTVLAQPWTPGHVYFDPILAEVSARRSLTQLTCETDENGEFTLVGIDPKLRYRLSAFKKGWICKAFLEDVLPGEPSAVLEIDEVFALQYRLVAGVERKWTPSENLFSGGSRYRVMSIEPPQGDFVKLGKEVSEMVGFEIPGGDSHFLLFAGRGAVDEIGPFGFHAAPVGYQEVHLELWAKPVASGIKETVIEVVPKSTFGTVSISASGYPGDLSLAAVKQQAGTLHFHSVNSDQEFSLDVTFGDLLYPDDFAYVPAGTYDVSFMAFGERLSVRPATGKEYVEVTQAPLVLDLDFSSHSVLDITVLNPEGGVDTRPFALQIGSFLPFVDNESERVTNLGSVTCRWRSSQSHIQVLVTPGEYQVTPLSRVIGVLPIADADQDGYLVGPLRVSATAGNQTSIVLSRLFTD
jgi:hypothetical protein